MNALRIRRLLGAACASLGMVSTTPARTRDVVRTGTLFTELVLIGLVSMIVPAASGEESQHWSFRTLDNGSLPSVSDASWPVSAIDAFVLARLEANGLAPAKKADRRTLIRRVSYDLIGLPPAPSEVNAFLRDESPQAFTRVVNRLLASPHFGERWGRHWLDVARYGEDVRPNGFQTRPLQHAYKYRDWVTHALNEDLPYDEFVIQQIAGDVIKPGLPSGRIAVGFLALGQIYESDAGGEESKRKAAYDTIDDKIDAITRGFLGLTVACARCHDHKFDPISIEDYYGLAGVLRGTTTVEAEDVHTLKESGQEDIPVAIGGNPNNPGTIVPRRFLSVLAGDDASHFRHGSGRLELARAVVTDGRPLATRVIVNRLWHHLFGGGLVGSPSNFGHLGEAPSHPELLDWLARRLIDSGWSLKAILREIVLSESYQMSGEFSPRYAAIDAPNRLLWRRLPKRLEAEAWRDGILATAGELDRQIGGPSDERLLSGRRRTVYAAISRAQRFASDKFLLTFDFPDPNITAGQRTQTTVPQQELFALNSPFIIAQARRFAARLRNESDTDLGGIRRAFELAFGRPPSADESELAQQFLAAAERDDSRLLPGRLTPWEQLAHLILASNEMIFVR